MRKSFHVWVATDRLRHLTQYLVNWHVAEMLSYPSRTRYEFVMTLLPSCVNSCFSSSCRNKDSIGEGGRCIDVGHIRVCFELGRDGM